jgi:DNA-binding LytR/AlgR family response regulator
MIKKNLLAKKIGRKKSSPPAINHNGGLGAQLTLTGSEFAGVLDIRLLFAKGSVQLLDCSFKGNDSAQIVNKFKKIKTKTESVQADPADTLGTEAGEDVFIRENKILHKLNLSDVQYIKAMGDYVRIYTAGRKIMVHNSLKSLEKKLPQSKFIRIHRSYMVAIKKIEVIEESTIYIDSQPIPIGEVYRSKLMKFLSIIK